MIAGTEKGRSIVVYLRWKMSNPHLFLSHFTPLPLFLLLISFLQLFLSELSLYGSAFCVVWYYLGLHINQALSDQAPIPDSYTRPARPRAGVVAHGDSTPQHCDLFPSRILGHSQKIAWFTCR